jgi:protoporphyrinogen IX oxidase
MLWLLLLHISAVVFWCGSLLYVPALIAGMTSLQTTSERKRQLDLMLTVFRLVSTPTALIAIASGTALFITGGITELWLILKLTLVSALVLCHACSGWVILYVQKIPDKKIMLACVMLGTVVTVLVPAIVSVVLLKPF